MKLSTITAKRLIVAAALLASMAAATVSAQPARNPSPVPQRASAAPGPSLYLVSAHFCGVRYCNRMVVDLNPWCGRGWVGGIAGIQTVQRAPILPASFKSRVKDQVMTR